ncbi:MAG: TlpA family protein disulfide reductase [Clostridia bacterium]|nr:TlpA family protein disulfide reductase [Clostridia bacterium]
MNKKFKWLIALLILALLIAGASVLYTQLEEEYMPDRLSDDANTNQDTVSQQETYIKAPDFTVVDSLSEKVKLSDMRGKPVVVNFWASWCPPCKAEMPDFEKLYKTYGDDITIMMVNMTDGYQETYEKAEAHIKENNYTFPVYYDIDYSAATAYRVTSLPATYFIDAQGNLVTHAKGMIDYETLKKGIGMIVPK